MLNIDEQQLMHVARQHQNRGELQPAAHICRQIISTAPHHSEAWHLLGVLTLQEGKYADAIPLLERAIALQPNHQDFHINLGIALAKLDRNQEAVQHYQTALALAPDYAAAYYNLGCSLFSLKRLDEAAEVYRHTLCLNPSHVGSRVNLGNLLAGNGETPQAEKLLREALTTRPENAAWHSNLIYALQFHPDYTGARLLAEAQAWNNRHAEPLRRYIKPHMNDRTADRQLRIGYVSPDFKDHVAGRYMMPLFRHYNRHQFEVHCFGSVTQPDRITRHFQQLAHYHDISPISDEQAADLIRHLQMDILIDLSLHMAGNRLRIFAMKPAPMQVTYLAYPGTTGLSTMDYRISDPYLDPPDAGDTAYTETTIRLPRSFWCFELSDNRFDSMPPDVNELPAISRGYFTFGSLNNFRKINPTTLELWGKVLAAVPRSRMIILAQEGSHQLRAKDFLEAMGVSRDRIRFEPLRRRQEYLHLYHQIDIGLDPLPYNGHSTSLDSYYMGVPVITRVGNTVVGRGGFSQLMNLGMPELIAGSDAQYVTIACDLASNIEKLAILRKTLRARLEASPIMNGAGFVRDMEFAYRSMWRTWCASAAAALPIDKE